MTCRLGPWCPSSFASGKRKTALKRCSPTCAQSSGQLKAAAAQRWHLGWQNPAKQQRERAKCGGRWPQTAQGQQSADGCRYGGPSAGVDGHACQCARARPGRGIVRTDTAGYRWDGQSGLGRPGLHGREQVRSDEAQSRIDLQVVKLTEVKKSLVLLPPALGRRAQFCLADPAQATGPRFRTHA